jgi:hypothetical protein
MNLCGLDGEGYPARTFLLNILSCRAADIISSPSGRRYDAVTLYPASVV